MRGQGLVRWVALFAFLFSLSTVSKAALKVELVAGGFSRPVFVCSPPGDTNRLFVVQQHNGQIRIYDRAAGAIKPTAFLTIAAINRGGEEGLLGLAFHPNYRSNGFFYVNLTPSGGTRRTEIVRFRAQGDPATSDLADAASRKLILSYTQPESNHNGGWIGFGPDDYLYIASGDGGGGNDEHGTIGNGQDRTSLLGKILRIDVDGGDPYSIPPTNPFQGDSTFANEIWAFGLRNPWRCSFDRETGHLWIGDVGQGAREEIDVIPNGVGGLNFGWRPREGLIQTPAYPNETPVTPAVNPVFDYARTFGFSVTGGYVYRGDAIPELRGKYVFADYGSARFWAITPGESGTNGTAVQITADLNPDPKRVNNISSFGEDEQGELYICDLDGQIFKIVVELLPPRITEAERSGENLLMSFDAAAGQSYAVEASALLGAGAGWATTGEIASAATNRTVTVTNAVTGPALYFRIRAQQP